MNSLQLVSLCFDRAFVVEIAASAGRFPMAGPIYTVGFGSDPETAKQNAIRTHRGRKFGRVDARVVCEIDRRRTETPLPPSITR